MSHIVKLNNPPKFATEGKKPPTMGSPIPKERLCPGRQLRWGVQKNGILKNWYLLFDICYFRFIRLR
jgi:hypothetical protein